MTSTAITGFGFRIATSTSNFGRRGIPCLAGGSSARAVPASCPRRANTSPLGRLSVQHWVGPTLTQATPAGPLGQPCSVRCGGVASRRGGGPASAAPAAALAAASQRTTASVVKGAPGGSSSNGAASVQDDWRQEVITALALAEGFAELTIRAKVASAQPWHTITVRPVSLRGARHLQVTTFTARQSLAANHPLKPGEGGAVGGVDSVVRPLLQAGGLGSVTLRTASGDLAVQITKRGKGIVHRTSPQGRPALVSSEPGGRGSTDVAVGVGGVGLSHDRPKATPIPSDQPHAFLQKIGFQTADGRIKATMQDKFAQVNEFLKLLSHTGLIRELIATNRQPPQPQSQPQGGKPQPQQGGQQRARQEPDLPPLHILDCGCGSSHLSFGTYHYLNHVLGLPASLGGVDVNAELMRRANDNAEQLGLTGARFDTAHIGDYSPPVRPDIVLALHACDTATDDALALAVKQASPLIMAVPCCHAHLHKQLSGRPPISRPPWAPLLRHGILRQRQLDLLTDTLRAQLLRVAGYQTDVVEFISTEHTPRNLLIRAVRQQQHPLQPHSPQPHDAGPQPGQAAAGRGGAATAAASAPASAPTPTSPAAPSPSWPRQQVAAAREYVELRDYWGVTPRLEVLLAEELGPLLAAAAAQQQRQQQSTGDDDDDDGSGGAEADDDGAGAAH